MSGCVPKFSSSDLVDVTEYYLDLIPKSHFRALVLEYNIFSLSTASAPTLENGYIIYDLLGVEGQQLHSIQTAEEYAIRLIEKSNKGNKR